MVNSRPLLPLTLALAIAGCTSPPSHTVEAPEPGSPPATDKASGPSETAAPAPAASATPPAESAVDPPSAREARGIKRLTLLTRGNQIPAFRLPLMDGQQLDTATLAGSHAYVVVFFTSWCPVCERKMPIVQRALEKAGDGVVSIGVPLDEDETWKDVAAYLKRHQLPFRAVSADGQTEIVEALDPKMSFPIVYVVGRDGVVLDVQLGLKADHGVRLDQALRAGRGLDP
jgi:peroxiredoxin